MIKAPTYPQSWHSHFVQDCGRPWRLMLLEPHFGHFFVVMPVPRRSLPSPSLSSAI